MVAGRAGDSRCKLLLILYICRGVECNPAFGVYIKEIKKKKLSSLSCNLSFSFFFVFLSFLFVVGAWEAVLGAVPPR